MRARHGKANIVCMNLQLDEKSPHMVAYVVPLTADSRLAGRQARRPIARRRVLEGSAYDGQAVRRNIAEEPDIDSARATSADDRAPEADQLREMLYPPERSHLRPGER